MCRVDYWELRTVNICSVFVLLLLHTLDNNTAPHVCELGPGPISTYCPIINSRNCESPIRNVRIQTLQPRLESYNYNCQLLNQASAEATHKSRCPKAVL